MTKTIIVLGTSRSDGNTRVFAEQYSEKSTARILDLNHYKIGYYDYEHVNCEDDFLGIITELLNYEKIVLATPVYWYAMSAQMKGFIDRFSDLITIRKDLGRALAGKSLKVIATGSDDVLPEGFCVPFKLTAEYFEMSFCGCEYQSFAND